LPCVLQCRRLLITSVRPSWSLQTWSSEFEARILSLLCLKKRL
jgi:hypothetical protein